MTVYEEIGLPRVINASGRVTVLGVSTISDKVAKAAVAGGQSYVVVEDLLDKAGEIISRYTGGEDSCPTTISPARSFRLILRVVLPAFRSFTSSRTFPGSPFFTR